MPTQSPAPWIDPPAHLKLDATDVHVWRVVGELSQSNLDLVAASLNPEEISRAAAYRFDPDRNRFIACRGILRVLLGRYLSVPPQSVRFATGSRGKPALAGVDGQGPPVQFNLSHTKGMALFAFTAAYPVGIDVEAIDPKRRWESLAERFLHPNEWKAISSLPESQRTAAFFACWTWKEAYVKARGDGLTRGLATFEVVPDSFTSDTAILDEETEPDAARWSLRALSVPPGFAAAMAIPCREIRLHCYNWDPVQLPAASSVPRAGFAEAPRA